MAKDRKWAWSQFGQLKTCHDLETYLDGRELTTEATSTTPNSKSPIVFCATVSFGFPM